MESLETKAFTYRFTRGRERVDLMVTDRLQPGPRYRRREILQVPGSASAARHTKPFALAEDVSIRIPDVTAALSLKEAACETASADPVRHVQDGVLLLACAGVHGARTPSKSERQNINRLVSRLSTVEGWSMASHDVRRLAVLGLIEHYRPEWTPPSFVVAVRPSPRKA